MTNEWLRIRLRAWQQIAIERFGPDPNHWRFVCPSCGHVQTRQDFRDLGMPERQLDNIIGFSCIGRWNTTHRDEVVSYCEESQGYGCTYAGGGSINISPYTVLLPKGDERPTFGFAPCS